MPSASAGPRLGRGAASGSPPSPLPASAGREGGWGVRERLAAFLAAGQHGDMGWLASRTNERGDPCGLWPDARSVIATGVSYAPDRDPLATLDLPDRGTISVYAQGRDYHDPVKGMLKHLA